MFTCCVQRGGGGAGSGEIALKDQKVVKLSAVTLGPGRRAAERAPGLLLLYRL